MGAVLQSGRMAHGSQRQKAHRIVFLTRDPVVHQPSGSTTYALGLLELLRNQGAEVTLVATTVYSRSPRLFFRAAARPNPELRLRFPGYLRLGNWYVLPLRIKPWARMLSRLATRHTWLRSLSRLFERYYGDSLYTGAWDLSRPTPAECALALREIAQADATVVVGNYCLWGSLLSDVRLKSKRTAILMHDLLSARVQRFLTAGLPLDCPPITEAEEMTLLSGVDTVLAAQETEAGPFRARVRARGFVPRWSFGPLNRGGRRRAFVAAWGPGCL